MQVLNSQFSLKSALHGNFHGSRSAHSTVAEARMLNVMLCCFQQGAEGHGFHLKTFAKIP